ncbi:MAG: hypothetical protein MUF34_07240 [Polyangiaceae bacterium]|jgi:hypothetical protein|nr:hypothetical protein [Polyangiaceae bacterium]
MRRAGRQPRRPSAIRSFRLFAGLVLALAAVACGHQPRVEPLSATASAEASPLQSLESVGAEPSDAEWLAGLASPEVTPLQAAESLFARPSEQAGWLAACRGSRGGPIGCLLEARFAEDPSALKLALSLYTRTGSVVGAEDEHWVDRHDGERAHLLPALPVGSARKQLDRVVGTLLGVNDFLAEVARLGGRAPRFRATGLRVRFFRPEGPADAEIYTSEGQLGVPVDVPPQPHSPRAPHRHRAAAARVASVQALGPRALVRTPRPLSRDDVVRALVRLNDGEHGGWSKRALGNIYHKVLDHCGSDTRCHARFDPRPPGSRPSLFREGGNPADYGVELIFRYYREQKAALSRPRSPPPAFKCAEPENGLAWSLAAGEFFAGFDRSAACP